MLNRQRWCNSPVNTRAGQPVAILFKNRHFLNSKVVTIEDLFVDVAKSSFRSGDSPVSELGKLFPKAFTTDKYR